MPVFRVHTTLDLARKLSAFLHLDAGIIRGAAPDPVRLEQSRQRGRPRRLSRKGFRPAGQNRASGGPRKRRSVSGASEGTPGLSANTYETLYEAHAQAHTAEDAVGGSFDVIGRLELEILLLEGLKPTDTLLDLGCGTGRLAVHSIPALNGGAYIGIDISQSMLDEAHRRVQDAIPEPQCEVLWAKQTTPVYPLDANSVDVICAFSVFTHMEHEDTYRYLKEALRIVRPGGRFIFSCLPMNLNLARTVFLNSAATDLEARWSEVRNVTTSVDFMNEIARMAGWTPVRWYDGEEKNIRLPDTQELHNMGQSVCVLQASHEHETGSMGG